jgi:N-acetylglutamate synthase-like GNAT family acetyltransferase
MTVDQAVSVRNARAEDLAAVHALLKECDLPTSDVDAQALDGFVVAEAGGPIVGVAGIERHGRYGLLRSVAASESMRGRGIGRAVVEGAIANARARGINDIYLLTVTADGYFPALGFTRVDRDTAPEEIRSSSQFTFHCPTSAVLMRLDQDESVPSPS